MKFYTQFLELQKDLATGETKIMEALGSDGRMILDGRNRLVAMRVDSTRRMRKLENVQPGYIGYRIMKGERFASSECVFEWINEVATKQLEQEAIANEL